jgi:hypothetical protein
VPVAGSQTRTVASSLAVASQDPSGATPSAFTPLGVAGEGVAGGAGDLVQDLVDRRTLCPPVKEHELVPLPAGRLSRLGQTPGRPVRGWPAAAAGHRYQLRFRVQRTAPGSVIVRQ